MAGAARTARIARMEGAMRERNQAYLIVVIVYEEPLQTD